MKSLQQPILYVGEHHRKCYMNSSYCEMQLRHVFLITYIKNTQ